MPNVPFTLKTFGLETTRGLRAQVVFTPSTPGAIGPDGMLIRRVVVPWSAIDQITGIGVAVLAATTSLRPKTHYIVSVEWLDGVPSGWAEIAWPVRVPPGGGTLSELIELPTETGVVRVGRGVAKAIPGVLVVDIAGDGAGRAELVFEKGAYL
ncbi:hypothetical protein [Pseudoclavibacter sp. 8L]|uniref:hypothetical protein n=1 Tax=Pseudoclavibacter sp. 8L TaxID=2653162 RepID=UPI0012F456B0|nr:hypothetical protein [Pseudoclavibacter sp. 8L]VXB32444.1 conserved hypothetical protein [Pseudoclavibacter sp. 8L]